MNLQASPFAIKGNSLRARLFTETGRHAEGEEASYNIFYFYGYLTIRVGVLFCLALVELALHCLVYPVAWFCGYWPRDWHRRLGRKYRDYYYPSDHFWGYKFNPRTGAEGAFAPWQITLVLALFVAMVVLDILFSPVGFLKFQVVVIGCTVAGVAATLVMALVVRRWDQIAAALNGLPPKVKLIKEE